MTNLEEINYTFIIPHKNIPNLLSRCLASIPRREDIQIIVVDDNSDKDIVDFEHFPGLNEPCVEVYFTKEGKGAGYARNVGLSHAKGKWLLFVDADDFLVTDALVSMDEYIDSSSDIVYFRMMDNKDSPLIPNGQNQVIDLMRSSRYNKCIDKGYDLAKIYHIHPGSKMVNRSSVVNNNIKFDEVPCSNDVMFFTKLGFCVKQVTASEKYLYCRTAPLSHNLSARKDYEASKSRLQVHLARNLFFQEHGLNNRISSALPMIWRFRHLGFKTICQFIMMVVKSSTPLYLGTIKLLRIILHDRVVVKLRRHRN